METENLLENVSTFSHEHQEFMARKAKSPRLRAQCIELRREFLDNGIFPGRLTKSGGLSHLAATGQQQNL